MDMIQNLNKSQPATRLTSPSQNLFSRYNYRFTQYYNRVNLIFLDLIRDECHIFQPGIIAYRSFSRVELCLKNILKSNGYSTLQIDIGELR